jgi:hypothetical protein
MPFAVVAFHKHKAVSFARFALITILAQNLLSPPLDRSFNRQDVNLFVSEDKSKSAWRPLIAETFNSLTQTILSQFYPG